jgi:hypothetical protein
LDGVLRHAAVPLSLLQSLNRQDAPQAIQPTIHMSKAQLLSTIRRKAKGATSINGQSVAKLTFQIHPTQIN